MDKTLRVGLLSAVQNLDPLKAQDFVSAMVVAQIFEKPYLSRAADQPSEPVVFAEPLEGDPDAAPGTAYSAAVRPGLEFSDGTALTPEHVVAALRRAGPLVEQAEIEARGERVAFRLKRPNARFDLALTQTYCSITLEKDGRLLGTGPYMPAADATPEVMRLVRNPRHRRAPDVEELVFTYYPPSDDGRPERLLAAFGQGEVDFCNVLPRGDVSGLREVRKHFEPGNSTAILYFNTERPGLADRKVRAAIARALDRLEISQISYTNALAFRAKGLLPPMMSAASDELTYDLDRAREALAEAGAQPRRLSLLLIFGPRPYLPHPRQVAEYVTKQLGELGVAVDVETTEGSADYYRKVASGDYDLALAGWIADTLDPADFLDAILAPHAIPSPDAPISIHANLARWRHGPMTDALVAYRAEPSDARLAAIYKMVRDETPLVPLTYGSNIYVHAWRVRNLEPSPLGIPDFAALELRD